MEDKLIEILSQYDYPVILQGSLAQGEEYLEHFFYILAESGRRLQLLR